MASKIRRDIIILAVASVVFLISTQVLSFVGSTFVSPDETANAFFSEIFSTQGRLYSFEPLDVQLGDFFFPRGVVAIEGRLLPIGFLGLPILFGSLIRFFGFWSATFWTPLFAVLAVWAWYAIMRKVFDRRVGLFSALLLFVTPAWWYWTARPFMPNVLFVSFLIFTSFFLVVRPIYQKFTTNRWLDYVLAGLMLGGALWIRVSEVFWLLPLAIFILLVLWKKISWSAVLFFLVALIVSLAPLLFLNKSLYGDYFMAGYTVGSSGINLSQANSAITVSETSIRTMIDSVLPFGFHPRAVLYNVWNYGLLMFWWLILPALVGMILLRKHWKYTAGILLAATILGIVSGSAAIHDNPDLSAVTIGNSYSRYWLSLFVAITPLVAVALLRLGDLAFWKKIKKIIPVICFVAILALSVNTVFFSSDDALWPTRTRLAAAETIRDRLLVLTEQNAVIITERGDKLFFPDRVIRFPLRDETTYAILPQIIAVAPLYYYGITLPQSDLDYLNNLKLVDSKLRIDLVENLGAESLYRFTNLSEP